MEEELIEAFDNFVIGNFSAVLALCSHQTPTSEFSKFMWDSLSARCHVALGHVDKLRTSTSQVAGYFAVFQRSQNENDVARKTAAFDKIIAAANQSSGDPVACYYACVARAVAGDLIDAINYAKAVSASSPAEFIALRTQFCLAIHRPDLANTLLAEAASNRDDSAASKLVSAMHALITGKTNEACMSYSDLMAQFNAETALPLANGRAVGNIQRGLFGEAQEDIEAALSETPQDADSLRNLICCLAWQGKRREALSTLEKLRSVATHASHPLLQDLDRLNSAFVQFA